MPGLRLTAGEPPERLARANGFTLIELMVTCAVVGILAVVAAPVMTGIMNNSRLTGHTNEVVTALQFARGEAVRRNRNVMVCGSADGSACGGGWANWLVMDADNAVLQRGAVRPPVQLSATVATITYRPTGFPDAAAITVCIPVASPAENQRVVSVNAAGQVSTTRQDGGGECS